MSNKLEAKVGVNNGWLMSVMRPSCDEFLLDQVVVIINRLWMKAIRQSNNSYEMRKDFKIYSVPYSN
jgi:hypothetical protein